MTSFAEFDAYLTPAYSVDHWSDHALDHAQELVQQFTVEDWQAVQASWQTRSQHWQQYCAEALSSGAPQYAIPLLLEMVQSANDEVVIAAADALREWSPESVAPAVTPAVRARLQAVADQHPGIAARVIGALLDQVGRASDT